MPAGRPTEYSEKILQKAIEYLDSCEDDEIQQTIGMSAKGTELFKNKVVVNLPTIEGLALHLGIHRDTIYEWEKSKNEDESFKYPEFSDILGKLRAKQANMLINKGLSGDYNPTIAKVLLTKHGYREGIDQTSDGKTINGNTIVFKDFREDETGS
jgi:hypothetical protein